MNITTKIERSGVISLGSYSSALIVNSDDLLQLIQAAVDDVRPACDYNGSFAGRVMIEIEFLGDMEEQTEVDSSGREQG